MGRYEIAENILKEFGIEIVPPNVTPSVGQTRAVATLQGIIDRRGLDHARFVLMTFCETSNSKAFINAVSLWAVSDMVKIAEKKFPKLVTTDVSSWFAFFDGLPLGWLNHWVADLDGLVPKRPALVGMIYERMKRVFGTTLQKQPDLFDDRRQKA